MKRLILFCWLMALPAFSQGLFQNPWSTNHPPLAVRGLDNLTITNLGSGTDWWFRAVGPKTVARLTDVTNIITSATGALSGTFIAKQGGAGNNNALTNLNVVTNLNFDSTTFLDVDPVNAPALRVSDVDGLYIEVDASTFNAKTGNGILGFEINNQQVVGLDAGKTLLSSGYTGTTNVGTLDVAGAVKLYNTFTSPNGIIFDSTHSLDYDGLGSLDGANMSIQLDGHLTVNDYITIGSSAFVTAGFTSAANATFLGGMIVNLPITNTSLSPSKLVSTGTGTQLVSSVYAEGDFTRIISGGSTNQGITNGYIIGPFFFGLNTNTFLITTGQTASAVGMTYIERTNGSGYVPIMAINPTNGFVGFNTNSPTQALEVQGNVIVSGNLTNNNNNITLLGNSAQLLFNDTAANTRMRTSNGGGGGSARLDFASTGWLGWNSATVFSSGSLDLSLYRHGVGTNGIFAGASVTPTPTGSLIASNAVWLGDLRSQNKAFIPTNTANFYTVTNDLVPGTINLGPAQRFSVSLDIYGTATLAAGFLGFIGYSNAATGVIQSCGRLSIPSGILAADTTTNQVVLLNAEPNSMFWITNTAGGQSVSVVAGSSKISGH